MGARASSLSPARLFAKQSKDIACSSHIECDALMTRETTQASRGNPTGIQFEHLPVCADLYLSGRRAIMRTGIWVRPDFEEVKLGCEINCYAPAEV